MKPIVFTGPTIPVDDAGQELDARYRPPATQGDVYRAAQERPPAIGIIDGSFQRAPAVWHKEILWAMSRGIHVFGSASMGALRAAELAQFGMEGVGTIFEAYRDGVIEDDDEVAVAHGPAEIGYRGQSEAMVNIRSTLARAADEGILTPDVRELLEGIAKELFYPERRYDAILRIAAERGVAEASLDSLAGWLPTGRMDRKRDDAVAMLRHMRRRLADGLPPKRVSFTFQHTVYWEELTRRALRPAAAEEGDDRGLPLGRLLDELRLTGLYPHAVGAGLGRLLAIEEARRWNAHVTPRALHDTADTIRREHDLLTPQDTERWLEENDLTADELRDYVEEEALLRWLRNRVRGDVTAHLLHHLRSTGEYGRLLSRARRKQRVLEANGLLDATLADTGLSEDKLIRWFLENRLGRPHEGDIASLARAAGFADNAAFTRALVREFLFTQHEDEGLAHPR